MNADPRAPVDNPDNPKGKRTRSVFQQRTAGHRTPLSIPPLLQAFR
jgi:hypothetical protein